MAYLFPGTFLYVGPGGQAASHEHHAVQIVLSRGGPFELELEERALRAAAAIIPAGHRHALDASGLELALVLLEKQGPLGAALNHAAGQLLGRDLLEELGPDSFPEATDFAQEAQDWVSRLVGRLGMESEQGRAPSLAVRRTLQYIEQIVATRSEHPPRLTAAARQVKLSPTTLTHRFSREVGIPFRRYVLWSRLKRAVQVAQSGASLTDAAHAAGFSDSAHLSRTFRRTFGLSPSLIFSLAEIAGSLWDSSSSATS